jgi:hypothetical protein
MSTNNLNPKLSRSAVELHESCRKCFLLAYQYKVRPSMLPFTLNSAVDQLVKNEFDYYRKKGEPHPMFSEHDMHNVIPFDHPNMDDWRNNFKGVRHTTPEWTFYGAIDDIWVKDSGDGELIVVDVKATAKNVFDWEDTVAKYEYPKAYQRQLEMYQYLLRKNGFDVSPEAYLLYFNGRKNELMFDQTMKFDRHLIKIDCDDSWVEGAINAAASTLKEAENPEYIEATWKSSDSCENCNYLRKRLDVAKKREIAINQNLETM